MKASDSPTMTLAQMVERLSRHPAVAGLMAIGSAAREDRTAASDFDLVVVLAIMPVPLHVGLTSVDGTLTDLLFVRASQIDEIVSLDQPVPEGSWLGRILRWLEAGAILHDPAGSLARAQRKARSGDWVAPSQDTGHGAWFALGYNLAQTGRLLRSEDPVYQVTADLRMALYGPRDLLYNYFQFRDLRWEGEKAAVRHLTAHDPDYLALLLRFLREPDRAQRYDCYRRLAALTAAPLGPVWAEGETAFAFDVDDVSPEMVAEAQRFWRSLLEGEGAGCEA